MLIRSMVKGMFPLCLRAEQGEERADYNGKLETFTFVDSDYLRLAFIRDKSRLPILLVGYAFVFLAEQPCVEVLGSG